MQLRYPSIYRHRKACLSKQSPWHAAGDPHLACSRSQVRAPAPTGALCMFFFSTLPSFLLRESFLHLPHQPRKSVRVKLGLVVSTEVTFEIQGGKQRHRLFRLPCLPLHHIHPRLEFMRLCSTQIWIQICVFIWTSYNLSIFSYITTLTSN